MKMIRMTIVNGNWKDKIKDGGERAKSIQRDHMEDLYKTSWTFCFQFSL